MLWSIIHFLHNDEKKNNNKNIKRKKEEKEKKAYFRGIIQAIVSQSEGAFNRGVADDSGPDCCTVRHLMTKKRPQMLSLCTASFKNRPLTCQNDKQNAKKKKRKKILTCGWHYDSVKYACCESCNAFLQRSVIQPSSLCSSKAMKLYKPLG